MNESKSDASVSRTLRAGLKKLSLLETAQSGRGYSLKLNPVESSRLVALKLSRLPDVVLANGFKIVH